MKKLRDLPRGRAVMYFTLPIDKRKSVLLGRQLAAQKFARATELGRYSSTSPAPGGAIAAARAARDSLAFGPPAAGGMANGHSAADGHSVANGHGAAALPAMRHESPC